MPPRARIRHVMKSWPEYFREIRAGRKRFDVRKDDREGGFQVGDEILYQEFDWRELPDLPEEECYTGAEVLVRIDYIMTAADLESLGFLHSPNFVILGISLVN